MTILSVLIKRRRDFTPRRYLRGIYFCLTMFEGRESRKEILPSRLVSKINDIILSWLYWEIKIMAVIHFSDDHLEILMLLCWYMQNFDGMRIFSSATKIFISINNLKVYLSIREYLFFYLSVLLGFKEIPPILIV